MFRRSFVVSFNKRPKNLTKKSSQTLGAEYLTEQHCWRKGVLLPKNCVASSSLHFTGPMPQQKWHRKISFETGSHSLLAISLRHQQPITPALSIFDLRLSLVDSQKTPEVSTRGKVSVNLFAKIRFLSSLWSPPQKGETIPATSKILKGAMGGLGRKGTLWIFSLYLQRRIWIKVVFTMFLCLWTLIFRSTAFRKFTINGF